MPPFNIRDFSMNVCNSRIYEPGKTNNIKQPVIRPFFQTLIAEYKNFG